MATLHLVQGPAGGGKTDHARRLIEAGQAALQADITALHVALTGIVRDARTGKYPDRDPNDPALRAAIYLQATIARYALRENLDVVVTTSQRNMIRRWQDLVDEYAATMTVTTIDPGIEVVTERLADPVTQILSTECQISISKWYGTA